MRTAGEVVTVGEFQKAKDLLASGRDIGYKGASSPVVVNENLEPVDQFAILRVQEDWSLETLETVPPVVLRGETVTSCSVPSHVPSFENVATMERQPR